MSLTISRLMTYNFAAPACQPSKRLILTFNRQGELLLRWTHLFYTPCKHKQIYGVL